MEQESTPQSLRQLTTGLESLINHATPLILSLKTLRPTKEVEAACSTLAALTETLCQHAAELDKQVKSIQELCKHRKKGDVFVSKFRRTKDALFNGSEPKSKATFKKSIQLLFNGKAKLETDSDKVQAQKLLVFSRCARIRQLGAAGVIVWAAAFGSYLWNPNNMAQLVFEYTLRSVGLRGQQTWHQGLIEILRNLKNEPSLCTSVEYSDFLTYIGRIPEPLAVSSPAVDAQVQKWQQLEEPRAAKYFFTNAKASDITKFPEPFRTAILNSRRWKWERSQNMEITSCWRTIFPINDAHDVSFSMWCSVDDGYRLNDIFEMKLS
ncbi:hypothetical protein BJY01DRAFT_230104 [Aspergillus pseudoustus]|uniref:Fungal N-terminal domain-containing protein n=1 Tax=Aspergillus pseudoustus TaxID=1810923 RepID=A0ABR4ID42_9EURO